jgi:tetratricopeptide (TPR) repeat protein
VFIGSGMYQEALDLQALWTPEQREAGTKAYPHNHACYLLNTAEALDNLGKTDAAIGIIAKVQKLGLTAPIVVVGSRCSQCWQLARSGQLETAVALAERIDPTSLGSRYAAEAHYTLAVLALAQGDFVAARKSLGSGLTVAQRGASIRNGLFLEAELELRSGNQEQAIRIFEKALTNRYQRQGGFWLSLFIEVYESQGRTTDAHRVRRLLAARDPQFASNSNGTSWLQ